MYIGANTLAPPMATPAVIRTAMKNAAELAAPVATAVTRNRIAFKSIVGRRPRESASLPAPKAPTAQPSNTDATAKPVPAASVPKGFCQGINGAVNHAAVEAEEEASDRSYAAQHDHISRSASLGVDARQLSSGSLCRLVHLGS